LIGDGHGSLQQGRRHKKPRLDDDIQSLALKEGEIEDLLAFLASLTSADYEELGDKELARQRALSRTSGPQRDGRGLRPEADPTKAAASTFPKSMRSGPTLVN
jgi:hypothetical protein